MNVCYFILITLIFSLLSLNYLFDIWNNVSKKFILSVSLLQLIKLLIMLMFAVSIKEKQDRHPTLYWLPKLHKRPDKACFIVNSSSCTTTVLSKLLTSCLTAVKNIGLDTMILIMKGAELTIFDQLKLPIKFSVNLNLITFRLLNCLHMIFYTAYYVTLSSYKR